MSSPCPPSTNAWTFSTETFTSAAMKARIRAESRTPAMPTTRCLGSPLARSAACTIASSGFETTTRMASGECSIAWRVTLLTISKFFRSRSSRLIPALRGSPAVMTTTSEPAVSA